jgi:hypothetical protein
MIQKLHHSIPDFLLFFLWYVVRGLVHKAVCALDLVNRPVPILVIVVKDEEGARVKVLDVMLFYKGVVWSVYEAMFRKKAKEGQKEKLPAICRVAQSFSSSSNTVCAGSLLAYTPCNVASESRARVRTRDTVVAPIVKYAIVARGL